MLIKSKLILAATVSLGIACSALAAGARPVHHHPGAFLNLERANGSLPDTIRSHSTVNIDEVQVSDKTLHRARLTNLSQQEAVDGCKRLSQYKIHCAALQVSAR